jgi:hypothetical protein
MNLSIGEIRCEPPHGFDQLVEGLRSGLEEHRAGPRLNRAAFQRQHQAEPNKVGRIQQSVRDLHCQAHQAILR